MNSIVLLIFNIFKYMNSIATVRKQYCYSTWTVIFISKFMWFYCSCTEKKNTKIETLKRAIQTSTI